MNFWRMSWPDRLLAVEAALALAVASLAVAFLPFRRVARLAELPKLRREAQTGARTAMVRRVRWAVLGCARRLPWQPMCFPQGLAAQWMLRRRGVPSVLYYGAATDSIHGLTGHVWVRDGDSDVVGGEIAARYVVLATFPTITPGSSNSLVER